MSLKRFGCVDVIRRITFPDVDRDKICGKGYSDDNLFRIKNYTREYNFEQIKSFISERSIRNIYTTWGCRNNPKEFRNFISDFENYCYDNQVSLVNLKSPSGRLYRGDDIETINSNWFFHLNPILFNNTL